jgi:hypothetical protein
VGAGFTNLLHLGHDALQNEFSQELLEDNHWDKRHCEGKTRFATAEHTKAPLARVLFSSCKIQRENLWLVVGCKYTNQRFPLRILQLEKRTLPLANSESKTWGGNVETSYALYAVGGRLQLILQLH